MSDESMQDRTETATPRRREESRRKGEIPKSQELGSALLLLAAAGLLRMTGGSISDGLGRMMDVSIRTAAAPPLGIDATVSWLRGAGVQGVMTVGPLLVALAAVGLLTASAQARGTLTFEPLSPKFERISPLSGLKRLFSLRSVVELIKQLIKLGIVALVIYATIGHAWSQLIVLTQQSPLAIAPFIGRYTVRVFALAGFALLALALADYTYQVWQHEKKLRMTKEEVKRENKESDGDPLVRARLRSMGRSLARARMMTDVPKADVVVTNPTHIAVALRYDPFIAPAPIVVAMGRRKTAERIKKIAAEAGVPMIENKPLARALIATARVGHPIPGELYVAVAEILAFVLGRRRMRPTIDQVVE